MHGTISEDGYTRTCDVHGKHGPLYSCPAYSAETLAEIARQEAQLKANLRDPLWCAKQVARGLPPEGIAIFRAMAGVDNGQDS